MKVPRDVMVRGTVSHYKANRDRKFGAYSTAKKVKTHHLALDRSIYIFLWNRDRGMSASLFPFGLSDKPNGNNDI